MKLHIVQNKSEGNTEEQIDALSKVATLVSDPISADIILCMTVFVMDETKAIIDRTGKPYAVYCWDYYLWAHEGKNPTINWPKYVALMKNAKIVFVPSKSQQLRLKELLNIDSIVIHTGIKTYGNIPVNDSDYVLAPVRFYPENNFDWAEKATNELGILLVQSDHKYSFDEFKKLVASCTFMTCPYIEASTGGLTLMEGLDLGKVSLVSNSPYMGAKDYLGEFGVYFNYKSYEEYKNIMQQLWTNRPKVDIIKSREHVAKFSFENMANSIYKYLCELI